VVCEPPAGLIGQVRIGAGQQQTKKVKYMSKSSVFCIATSRSKADRIVDHLKTESFSNKDISVLFPSMYAPRTSALERNTKAPGPGADIVGVLRWVAGIAPLAIPGVGPFIAAGPLKAALSGAVPGPTAGAISRSLVVLGLSEIEASQYEGKINEGNILLSVHTDDVGDIARARDIFDQAGAQSICTTGSARKDDKSKALDQASPLAERSFST
jgi:hypothetical protein